MRDFSEVLVSKSSFFVKLLGFHGLWCEKVEWLLSIQMLRCQKEEWQGP